MDNPTNVEGIQKHNFKEDDSKKIFEISEFHQMCLAIGLYVLSMLGGHFGIFRPLVYLMMFVAYILAGREVLMKAFKNIVKGRVFDENFLMSVATIGAIIIGEYPEAVGVMIFYMVGEYLEDKAVGKSRRDRKSTRLNSSHANISYAVFCLKKKHNK